jgi:hypothetical protein
MMIRSPNTAHGRGQRVFPSTLDLGHRRIAIWGQSNAGGRALQSSLSSSPLNADPDLAAYAAAPFDRVFIYVSAEGDYQPLEMGVNNGPGATAQFGVEFGLAVRWMRETTTGNLYLEKIVGSGTPIANFDPIDNFTYSGAIDKRAQGDIWLAGQGITITDNHWDWIQGESDSANSEAYYTEALQEIIDARLVDAQESASSRIVLAQMLPGNAGWGPGPFDAKAAIAAASPARIKIVQFIDSFLDSVHLDATGQLQLAYDTFEQLFDAPFLAV